MAFPNKAGDHADTDDILREELHAAGILTWQEHDYSDKPQDHFSHLKEMMRKQSGEVKTSTWGILHGWTFKRNWYYWVAEGPGLEITVAKALNDQFGNVVRVDGYAGGQCPIQRFKGLSCGLYHVDTPEGLKALADTIKAQIAKYAHLVKKDDE